MSKEEIMEAIRTLAGSQGLYGRLYEFLKEDNDDGALLNYLAHQKFKDTVDMTMFIENKM